MSYPNQPNRIKADTSAGRLERRLSAFTPLANPTPLLRRRRQPHHPDLRDPHVDGDV